MKFVDLKNKPIKNYSKFEETIKYLPRKEMESLLKHISLTEDKQRLRNKLLFNLLLSTGCRITEFLNIKISDLDFENSLIKIEGQNTKNKKSRVVRVKKDLILDLKDYLITNNYKSGYVWRNVSNNKPLTSRSIRYILNRYTKNLDLSLISVSPHVFRHSHCIYALREGVSINALQQQVGHLDITTTQIYSKIAGVEIVESYKEVSF